MKVTLTPADFSSSVLLEWQKEYTKQWTGPIDVYWLNQIVYAGQPFFIQKDGERVGYCVVFKIKWLSEFYLVDPTLYESLFQPLFQQNNISGALVSTRSPHFLSLCLNFNKTVTSIAYLFEDVNASLQAEGKGIFRSAVAGDAAWLKRTDYRRDFAADLLGGILYILVDEDEEVGYGTLSPNLLQPQYSDIGVWIDPAHRNKGLGREVILRLKQVCYDRKLIPTCGCDLGNWASKRMLEQAGFSANDRMLKVQWDF